MKRVWGWFVMSTRQISKDDYFRVTRSGKEDAESETQRANTS